ncbi:beta-ketoacyl synthase N-terminal-like domain-containing protein [Hydrocarboniphaga effusa]|uniref:beta-ketoacyl synthase N-terminal-like domain-containing protein n=1 Tax=Hydrocarboniphaga effusa TaxID=243629 RepID=UPI0035B2A789
MAAPVDIAIIGLSGCYAGAANAQRYWQNILDKVDAVAPADEEWTRHFLDRDHWQQRNDRIYTNRGGFLRDLAVIDPTEYGVMPSQADGGDPDHLLALKHAGDALADAGYRKKDFDRQRAGVILGRGTYTNRGQANVLAHALFVDELMDAVRGLRPDFSEAEMRDLHARLKQQLPPYSGELVGQLTPNVITGLICNRLDLMGPNYIVDAACASTMMALDQAVRELVTGRCDLMITGGVQAQTPPQLYVQFTQIKALSNGQLRPFQKGHSGTLLGEGVGMLVLKRLADAERDGDRVYSVIKGIGVASDGRAKGLLTPRPEGEVLAMRRAYESSGIDPHTIDLIEAHGTGTDVGDRTEIDTLKAIYGGRGIGPQIAVGTVKSMIGHCLPASGSASLIKTALALHHKVLPPTLCDEPDPELRLDQSPLYLNTETRPWVHGKSHARRAGVNAFGFGGINAHVILEEYRGPSKTQVQVLHHPAPTELVLLAANSPAELASKAAAMLRHVEAGADLAVLAKASVAQTAGAHRLAIVADDIADLGKKLAQAIDKLQRADAKPFKTRSGLHYGTGAASGKLCFVYPGEGAQYPNMLADLCLQFPQVRDWFDFIERTALETGRESRASAVFAAPTGYDEAQRKALEARLFEMDVAAESVFAASMAIQSLLDDLKLAPDAMLGHSTGENTAVTACGVRRFKTREEIAESVRDLNLIFRKLEAEGRIAEGTLLTIGALRGEMREALLADPGSMQVAMDNCPNQLVMFGPPDEAQALAKKLAEEGAICQELPFGRAYHTPLFKPLADAYREYFREADFGRGRTTLYSARSVAPFPTEPDAIRELAAQQWENPVRFTDTLRRLYDDGYRVFVEVGPSGNLTSFVSDTLRGVDDVIAVSSNSRRKADMAQLHAMLAQLFACGVSFDPAALYAHRRIDGEIDLLAEPVKSTRRTITLKLQMPTLRMPQDWAPAKRPLPVPASEAPKPAVVAGPRPVDATLPQAAIATPAAPIDPRMAALQSHFALMQDFMQSQARVLGISAGIGSGAAAAVASAAPLATRGDDLDPQYPLLGRIVELDAAHLLSERVYSVETDPFLLDHAMGEAPSARNAKLLPLIVVPFTFSVEIIAEAACRLCGDALKVTVVENARGHRWLALDELGKLSLRIVAERQPSPDATPRVAVKLFQLDTNEAKPLLVFEGHVLLADRYLLAPTPMPALAQPLNAARNNPAGELYRHGMFHGPRLQGVKRLRGWNEQGIEADMATIPTHDYFGFTQTPRLRTDPALLDAAGQLAGFWLTEKLSWEYNCFPFQIGRYEQYADPQPASRAMLGRGEFRLEGLKLDCQFDLLDAHGALLSRATGWEDRKYAVPQNLFQLRLAPLRHSLSLPTLQCELASSGLVARRIDAFDEGYLEQGGAVWMRLLAHLTLTERERHEFYRVLPRSGPRREEWLLGRVCAKEAVREWAAREWQLDIAGADIEIGYRDSGAPCVVSVPGWPEGMALPAVSISHSRRSAVAVCGNSAMLGIDFLPHQAIERVNVDDLIAGAFTLAEAQAFIHGWPKSDQRRAATALWCSKEAAAKASGTGLEGKPQEWVIASANLERRASNQPLVSVRRGGIDYDVELYFGGDALIALCRKASAATVKAVAQPREMNDGAVQRIS